MSFENVKRSDTSIPHSPNPIETSTYRHTEPLPGHNPAPLIFAHGASGSMNTPAVAHFLNGVSELRNGVAFQGNMNLKGRVKQFHTVAQWCNDNLPKGNAKKQKGNASSKVVLGGRSMGARAAVIAATELNVDVSGNGQVSKQLVLASYPLVSPSEDVRDQILLDLDDSYEVLFVIGSSDSMCPLDRLEDVRERMKAKNWLLTVDGADHGMMVKPKSAAEPVLAMAGSVAVEWLQRRDAGARNGRIAWRKGSGGGWIVESGWGDAMPAANVDKADDEESTTVTSKKGQAKESKAQKRKQAPATKDTATNGPKTKRRKIGQDDAPKAETVAPENAVAEPISTTRSKTKTPKIENARSRKPKTNTVKDTSEASHNTNTSKMKKSRLEHVNQPNEETALEVAKNTMAKVSKTKKRNATSTNPKPTVNGSEGQTPVSSRTRKRANA